MCQAGCKFYGFEFGADVTWDGKELTCQNCGGVIPIGPGNGVYIGNELYGHRVQVKSEPSVCPWCEGEHTILIVTCGDGILIQLPVKEVIKTDEVIAT